MNRHAHRLVRLQRNYIAPWAVCIFFPDEGNTAYIERFDTEEFARVFAHAAAQRYGADFEDESGAAP